MLNERLIYNVGRYNVVLVGMGVNNSFSRGFPSHIGASFPKVKEEENRKSPYGDRRKYGTVMPIVADGVRFCMCYVHDGGYKGGEYIHYDSLRECLSRVACDYGGKKIASPLIGASPHDGNGDRDKIIKTYEEIFRDVDIDVYDYEDTTLGDEAYRAFCEAKRKYRAKEITRKEFSYERNRFFWTKAHGLLLPMPEDFEHKGRFSWGDVINVRKTDLEN